MEEGTFPPSPGVAVPEQNNSWETPPASGDPNHNVFRNESRSDSSDEPSKKILKLVIGLFVVLTVILSFFTFITPLFSNEEEEDVTLVYWGLFNDENVVAPIIAQFEEENPHIKIDYKKQDLPEYTDRLLVRSNNGHGPDIFRFHNTWYPVISDVLAPLSKETIEKSEFNDNYYEFMKGDLIKDGTIYGIPLQTDTLSLFINTSLFQQASAENGSEIPIPQTWQQFIDASAALTKRDDAGLISIGGAGIGTYDNVDRAADILSLLFAQNGVDLNDPSVHQAKIADAIRFYTNFALVEGNVWDSTQDNARLAFSQGKLAMYFGYSTDLVEIKKQNPGLQVKVVPVPQLIADEKINVANYWAEGASSKSKHPKQAQIFLNFLARKDIQEKLHSEQVKARQVGEPFSYKSLAESLRNTDSFIFVDQSNFALSTPFSSGTMNISYNEKLNNYLKMAIDGVLSGGDELEAASSIIEGYSTVRLELNNSGRN